MTKELPKAIRGFDRWPGQSGRHEAGMRSHHPVQSHRSEKRVHMILSVRAAGFAVAACVLAATAAWSGPLQAVEGAAAPVATYYTDHAGAAVEVADFAANADQAAVAASSPTT